MSGPFPQTLGQLLIPALFISGCTWRTSELVDQTAVKLREISYYTAAAKTELKCEIDSCKNDYEKLMLLLMDKKVITAVEAKHFSTDAWGRRFQLQQSKIDPDTHIVKIISAGENGRFDQGKGDDVFVEFHFVCGILKKRQLSLPLGGGKRKIVDMRID